MIRAPLPSLRRLWQLGSAPAEAVARLDRALAAAVAVTGDLEQTPLVSDRWLEPLTRDLDLSGAFAALHDPAPRAIAPVDEATAAPREAARERPPAPARRRAPAGAAPSVRRTPLSAPAVTRAQVAPLLAGNSVPAGVSPVNRAAHGNVPVPHPARRAPHADAPAPARRLPAEVAIQRLRDRATRAGHPAALDGLIGAPAEYTPSDALLAEPGLPAAPSESAPRPAPAPAENGPETENPSSDAISRIARAVDRISARSADAPRRAPHGIGEPPVGEHPTLHGAPLPPRARAPFAPPSLPTGNAPAAPIERVGGFRGLAALAAAASQAGPERTRTIAGEAALPHAVVDFAREADLTERIDRILRREARRHGIDLSGSGG